MWDNFVDAVSGFWSENASDIVSTVVVVLVAIFATAIARTGIRRWENRIEAELSTSGSDAERERGQRLATIADVIRVLISISVIVIVILTIMGVWGIPMTPLIAVASTVGVAVGFGAQDVVRDVIAGFLILAEDQYSIGDVVTIAEVSGTVESIKLRTTVLRDLDGNRHFVPNGQIRVASNMTSEFSRLVVDIPVSYDTEPDRAMTVIIDEATALAIEPQWRDRFLEAPEMLGVNKFGDSAIDIRVLMTLTSESRWEVKREFLKRIKARFDREGIEIPYQHVTIVDRTGDASKSDRRQASTDTDTD